MMISKENENLNCSFCNLVKNHDHPSFIAEMQFGLLLVNFSQTYKGRCMYIYNKHATDITEMDMKDSHQVY
jgi:diadenosine tetraphosphate (Ap4A) HIT family hydrolase